MRVNKDTLFLLAGIFTSVLVYHTWFSFDIFTFSDYLYSTSDALNDKLNISFWTHATSLGTPDIVSWRTPVNILYGFLGSMGLDQRIAEKFILFWPYVLLSFPAGYIFLKKTVKSSLGAFLGSLFLCFNTYFLSINTQGHFLIPYSFFVLLASLTFLLKFSVTKLYLDLIPMIFLFSLSIWLDLRVAFLGFFVFSSYSLIMVCKQKKDKVVTASKLLVSLFLIMLMNIFWILPQVISNSLSYNTVLFRTVFGNQFWSILDSITTHHPFWKLPHPEWFISTPNQPIFLFLPLLVALFLLQTITSKHIFWICLFLIGVFLSKGETVPFSQIFSWLYSTVPGLSAFRDPSKFFILTILGMAVTVGHLGKIAEESKRHIYSVGIALFIFIIAYSVSSYVTGSVGSTTKPREYPNEYLQLNTYLASQSGNIRLIWVPTVSRWSQMDNRISSISGSDLTVGDWHQKISYSKSIDLIGFISSSEGRRSLIDTSVDYIVIPSHEWGDSNPYSYFGNRQSYVDSISQSGLTAVDIGVSNLDIYRVESTKPKFYLESVGKTENIYTFPVVNYVQKNASEILLEVKGIKREQMLVFTDLYNEKWSIYETKSFSIFGTILGTTHELPYKNVKTRDGLNSFIISGNSNDRIMESDTLRMTVFYKPQAYFVCGLWILVAVSTVLFSTYIAIWVNQRIQK